MTNIPIKIQFLKTLSNLKPHRIIVVKGDSDATFRLYITDKSGMPFPIEDLSGETVTIQNTDGNIDVTGTTNITLNISQNLLNTINSALQSGDNISELTNDAGYITTFVETDPIFQTSEANLFVSGDKAKLDTAIQPSDLGAVATSNDYNDLDNLPTIPTVDDFVPYVGATYDVDLGDNKLKANTLEISISPTEGVDIGRIVWNPEEGTFDMGLLNDVVLQSGQEMYFYAKASETISNGDAVQFNGSQGDHLLIKKAVPGEINLNPEYFIGVATQDFINNEFGYVTVFGKVRGLNTTVYTNPVLYFDSENVANGKLKDTIPKAPNAKITVAAVVRSHITQGVLMVRPHIMPKIENLQNVSNDSYNPITDNDTILVKDIANSVWKNISFSNLKTSIPDASETQRGLVNTGIQTFKGKKIIKGDVLNDNILEVVTSDGLLKKIEVINNSSLSTPTTLRGNIFMDGTAGNQLRITSIGTPGIDTGASITLRQADGTYPNPVSSGSHRVISTISAQKYNGGTYRDDTIFRFISGGMFRIYQRMSYVDFTSAVQEVFCIIQGNVGIGTTTPQAKLDVSSTTSGFLPPRMTQAQRVAIVSPAIGLHVYQTDATEGVYVYKSTGWTFAY